MARKKRAVKKVAADQVLSAPIKLEIKRMLEKLIKTQAVALSAASFRKPAEVRLTKEQGICLKQAICAAMLASPETVIEPRKRYCSSGKEGIWIGLADEQMADLIESAKSDCLRDSRSKLKPIDPLLGFTVLPF